ncbi:MAG: amidohydrolase family protein [Lachnospiraceae bacterium]|jgi:predicted TIM-barrel fold metal-dependent hydrolase|nr:amidohydrolase family protein [Lachnospiraceae bacterium]
MTEKRTGPLKIIDAHLHFCPGEGYFSQIAQEAGHENHWEHLQKEYKRLGIVGGVVMGNRSLNPEDHRYPTPLKYCVGLDGTYLREHSLSQAGTLLEENLRQPGCVGIKLYPGYNPIYVWEEVYEPVYELAERYKKPVAIHTGETAGPGALLKYCHPLTLDEVAARHPNVQLVMCHFGNPWLMDAAAVVDKNDNVALDLSGLLEGRMDVDQLFLRKKGYLEQLRTWLDYLDSYEDVMFGTDWPLVNLEEYIDFVGRLVPEEEWEKVFFSNANRIYQLGL